MIARFIRWLTAPRPLCLYDTWPRGEAHRWGAVLRTPTEYKELYRWHEGALLATQADRWPCTSDPECGWFAIQLAEKGPFFPAQIGVAQWTCPVSGELLGDEFHWCEVCGERVPLDEDLWLRCASRPISKDEHAALMRQLMDDAYVGPKRPRARWTDPQEIAADVERYALKGMTV